MKTNTVIITLVIIAAVGTIIFFATQKNETTDSQPSTYVPTKTTPTTNTQTSIDTQVTPTPVTPTNPSFPLTGSDPR